MVKNLLCLVAERVPAVRGLAAALLVGWMVLVGAACVAPDPCERGGGQGAPSYCLEPQQAAEYYVEKGLAYFDTMDSAANWEGEPNYSERVARWEWPPWLKLTAYTRDNILATDTLLQLYPSTVLERDCRFFTTQPFARCRVVFYYDDHDGRPCPIYEEFTFNDAGEMTFIEAWSDLPGMLPMAADDEWAEGQGVSRLSTRIPGLGNSQGLIDLDSEWMTQAAAEDLDVADFVQRAGDWYETWSAELEAAGDDLWERGCGW
tara:strand:- start:596 stop:1378 length:783 start_codon:yes stop_codon:yes gene_type:complete